MVLLLDVRDVPVPAEWLRKLELAFLAHLLMQVGHVTQVLSDALDTTKQRLARLIVIVLARTRAGD